MNTEQKETMIKSQLQSAQINIPLLPEKLQRGVQSIILDAIKNSSPGQLEIAIGSSATDNRKIRLIALPHNYGSVVDGELTIKVKADLGEVKPI